MRAKPLSLREGVWGEGRTGVGPPAGPFLDLAPLTPGPSPRGRGENAGKPVVLSQREMALSARQTRFRAGPRAYNGGRRSANLATPSQAWASWSASKSHLGGATICIPTGSPSGVKPAGTEIEGQPVTVIV